MKRFFITALLVLCVAVGFTTEAAPSKSVKTINKELVKKHKRWFEKDPRIDVVNETTVIFNDVIKIEIRTSKNDQVTYVYDLRHSKLVKVARGSFVVDLPRGNYLVQSDKRITRTVYEVVIE